LEAKEASAEMVMVLFKLKALLFAGFVNAIFKPAAYIGMKISGLDCFAPSEDRSTIAIFVIVSPPVTL